MTLSGLSLKRPVTATVANLLIIVVGISALLNLPVRELPDIDAAQVTVGVTYTGAAPDVVDAQITAIVEGAVAGIPGLDTMTSEAERGSSRTVLSFDTSRDIDEAANDVRAAVDSIISDLPDDAERPVVRKNDNQSDPVVRLALTSDRMSPIELTDYADRYIVDRLARLSGVANVTIFGERAPAMRIWLDMTKMAAHGITVGDITSALQDNNLERPAGEIETPARQIQVLTRTRFQTVAEFENLVLRDDGARPILLADVATVEPGAENTDSNFRADGRTAVGLGVQQQSQANTMAISSAVKAELEKIGPTLPAGTALKITSDDAIFIGASLREVVIVLGQALALVIAVIVLFLGSPRAAAVPVVTIPISLLGAIGGIYLAGFTVNLLTMFALILAIGLVVDDAIVVLENIQRRMSLGEDRRVASERGADQVNFAVIATTLVLIAVFIPISMMEGSVGQLFAEFGVTLAIAVAVSSFVALTLCPVLAARLLPKSTEPGRFTRIVDTVLNGLNNVYRRILSRVLDRPVLTLGVAIFLMASAVAIYERLPSALTPQEDRGMFMVDVTTPQGSNLKTTDAAARRVEAALETLREEGLVTDTTAIVGSWGDLRRAMIIVRLANWEDRTVGQTEIINGLRRQFAAINSATIRIFAPSGLRVRGGGRGGMQVMVGGPDIESAAAAGELLAEAMRGSDRFAGTQLQYNPNQPGATVAIDRQRARDLGLDAGTIAETVQVLIASRSVTEYTDRSRQYPVVLQAEASGRDNLDDLENIFVRTGGGDLVPLSGFVTITEEASAPSLSRFERVPSVEIGADLTAGTDIGAAIDFVRAAAEDLPIGTTIEFQGEAATFLETSGGTQLVFLMALLIVFLVLAAQFESFIQPVVILATVPLALTGAFGTLWWAGASLNVYSNVGLILLVGLMAKNGILIVEFANQLREEGRPLREAILEGSVLRLRPILMTTISTVLGAVPLTLATGAGAASRVSIGVVICGGFTFASILTLFVTPVVYELAARLFRRAPAEEHAEPTAGEPVAG
ncbi:efflux RND transporter permease subunit [Acuticoccus kandeliae]|uniref:efflux RND transporter permease subunit n=1 Tax=Acuticoccus kandeliae TaxID=2073160 RepID=UPI000D3EC82A|nr:efflux RND transporter permease subunit [Acuticoccus kandeliae]